MFAPLESGRIGFTGWYFIGLLLFLTWTTFRGRHKVATMPVLPSRTRHFISSIIVLLLIGTLALLVARVHWMKVLPPIAPTPLQIGAGLAVAGLLAAGMSPFWRKAVKTGDRRIYFFSPETAREKALWVGVSLCAAVAEEIAYRGVLYVLLLTLTHSVWAASLLAALIFAANHALQSFRSMAIILVFAIVFQALAFWTGALYVSMLAHFVYDVVAGFSYGRLVRELGYRADIAPAAPAASPEPTPAGG